MLSVLFNSYGEQTLKGGQGLVIFCLIIMIIEIIILIILLLINKDDDIETDKIRDNMVQSIILYTIFVFSLFFMFDLYNIEECNTYYIHNFDTDYFLINRTYTIINETKIYFSRNRQIYGEDLYQYDTFIFDYDDYPILKDIYEIHEKNSWKIVSNQKVTNSDSNLYFIFRFYIASFLPFIAYIFLFIYKCKNKCKIIYCIFYILSILINIITFTFPLIIKNYEYKENLKSEDDNIKYIIDDYNNYAKCVNRFPLGKIFVIIFILIQIIIFIFTIKNNNKEEKVLIKENKNLPEIKSVIQDEEKFKKVYIKENDFNSKDILIKENNNITNIETTRNIFSERNVNYFFIYNF